MQGLDDVVRSLAGRGQLVHLERLPARPARSAPLATPLPPAVAERLPTGGLWAHQAAAVDLARAGRSVAVATGTASGKSLCYQLPVAEAVIGGAATALLVYPTKALAQDQLRSLVGARGPRRGARHLRRRHAPPGPGLGPPPRQCGAHQPRHAPRRRVARARPLGQVPGPPPLRRPRRAPHPAGDLRDPRGPAPPPAPAPVRHYGSSPAFLFGSATIGRPAALASALCGLPVEEVTDDGSPRGERLFALWQPPLLDDASGVRASPTTEAAELLSALVQGGYRAIAFARSRKGAELLAAAARRRLPEELGPAVRPYRGGYLARERREIEAELFQGRLRAVAATTALELGIDVGSLDACVLCGFPGTIASMWQQAGRAGRARQRSLAVLVAGEDALDQWLVAHPQEVFRRSPEPAVVNPSNPFVLDPHLGCAAYELPLTPDDEQWWGEDLDEGLRRLVLGDRLRLRDGRALWAGRVPPAPAVGLRTGSADSYRIVDAEARLVGTTEEARAFSTVHPGALYLHQGQHYRVERLDLDDRTAWVRPTNGDETTRARSNIDLRVLEEEEAVRVGRARLCLGSVEVTEQVTGYRRLSAFTREVLGDVPLELPPTTLTTRAFWYTVGPEVLAGAGVGPARVPGTLHAAEHAGIGILPLFTICDRWDVGGLSTNFHGGTGLPTVFVYDGYPGGAGIAELGFAAGRGHLEATLEVISSCPCPSGCPSCVQSPKCGNLNEPLDKAGAVALLGAVLAR